jgi:hypothetical protein
MSESQQRRLSSQEDIQAALGGGVPMGLAPKMSDPRCADESDRRQLLPGVGMRADIRSFDDWGDRPRLSEFVIIADAERVDTRRVEALLDSCLVTS